MVAAIDFSAGDWMYQKKGGTVAPVQIDAEMMDHLRQPTVPSNEVFEPIPLTLQLLESADFHFVRTPDGAMKHGSIDTAMIRHTVTKKGIIFHFWTLFHTLNVRSTTCTNCSRFSYRFPSRITCAFLSAPIVF
jgi:hypothetical protein